MFDEQNKNNEAPEDTTVTNTTESSSAAENPHTDKQPNFVSFVPPPENSENNNSSQEEQINYSNYQTNTTSQENKYQSFYNTPKKPKSNNTGVIVAVCVGVFLLLIGLGTIGLLGSGILSGYFNETEATSSVAANTQSNGTAGSSSAVPGGDITINKSEASEGDALTGVQIADKVTPSIVGVLNYTENTQGQDFGYYYGEQPSNGEPSYTLTGQGSGILVDVNSEDKEHTYIITNQHVIDGAAYVGVVLYDENGMTTDNHYQAEVIGEDSTTDLALLRIKVTDLITAELADSDLIKKGETVYAIGNPGGLDLACSITQGIVSGVNRKLGSTNFIQTDVAVNPGNSGGALVNQYGQVVGIISQKLLTVSTTDAEGLSFAIPTSVAKPVLDDLLNYGYVTGRVSLNITCETVSDMAAYFNRLPNDVRVRVTSVSEGSAVAKQGLSVNDFIVEFNGSAVLTIDELAAERDKYKAGDTINMKIYRYSTGKYLTISFQLEEDKGS